MARTREDSAHRGGGACEPTSLTACEKNGWFSAARTSRRSLTSQRRRPSQSETNSLAGTPVPMTLLMMSCGIEEEGRRQ